MSEHESGDGRGHQRVPKRGDRVEGADPATGGRCLGTVHHVDAVQILVKWDDGRSESLDPEARRFRIVEAA